MNHALVLACGNPLRGDDGIAVVIARYFRAEFCGPETDIRSSQQWTPELAEPISQSDIVLFVDASATLPPGKIQFKKVEPAQEFSSSMTHTISPEALLALSVQLYSRTPECAYLLTIGGESFDYPDHLSESVRSAIPVALDLIKAALCGVSLPETPFALKTPLRNASLLFSPRSPCAIVSYSFHVLSTHQLGACSQSFHAGTADYSCFRNKAA
jgi:hydrogenase maturation protease